MGVKNLDSDGGFAKFGKGDNVYFKLTKIDTGWNERDDAPQLPAGLTAVPVEGGEPGTIPAYFSSKITIQEDDDYSSNLGKLLSAVDKVEPVLADLGISDDVIEEIMDGKKRYEAENEQENAALFEAVVDHLSEVDAVWKGGTKFGGDNDYSKLVDVIDTVDKNPFSDDPADSTTSEESDTEAADAEDDATALA